MQMRSPGQSLENDVLYRTDGNPNDGAMGSFGDIIKDYVNGNIYFCYKSDYDNNDYRYIRIDKPEYDVNGNYKVTAPVKTIRNSVVTDANGNFTWTFPAGFFTGTPHVTAIAIKSSTTAIGYADARISTVSNTSISGGVLQGRNLVLGVLGDTVAKVGAGVTVQITAVGL